MICKCPDKRKDGGSSFKNLCEYIAGIGNDEKVLFTEHKNFDDYPQNLDDIIISFNLTANHRNGNAGDPVFHAILSWCEGEIPTKEQVDEAVEIFLKEQGLQGHQCFYALHKNTNNLHAHICVSRVNPENFKTIRAGFGQGFWKKANELAARKIELAQGWKRANGKFYEVLEDNSIVEVKTDKVVFEKSISTKAKDFENLTGAKSGERIAREKLAPILFNASSWQELHEQLAENGARLQKKGAGLVLFVGEVPVKLSSVSQQLSLKKLEKRLGDYEAPKENVSPPKKIDEQPLIKEMPSIDEYLEKRKEYYEAKHKALAELKENYKEEWQELRERQKKERQEDYKSRPSWKGHGAELNWLRTKRAVLQLEEKERFKKRKKKQREEIQKMFNSRFPSYKQWLIDDGRPNAANVWRYREVLAGYVSGTNNEDSELYANSILLKYTVRQEKWNGKLASVFRNKADKVCFIDRGKSISVERFDDKDNIACALKLAQQKWGSVKVTGSEGYKNACIEVAIRNNIRITNPELQERIARRKAEIEKERQNLIKEQRMTENAKKIKNRFEIYDKTIEADTYRITVARRIQEGEQKGSIDPKHTWILKNATGDKELTAQEVKDRCYYIDKLLADKNEIYITPLSHKYHYILIDDVKKENMPLIPKNNYAPAIAIETSPNNRQLIMKVPKLEGASEATEKAVANKLMKELNEELGDPKISSAVHAHRMPCTFNYKPKYCEDENATPPQIILGYAKNVTCTKCEERLKELYEIQLAENRAEAEKRKAKMENFEKGWYSMYDDKLTPYDAYMCHARDIYQYYSGKIADERGTVNMSVIDSMVAERMVVTGYTEKEIAQGIASGSRDFRPDNEKDKHNWEEYGARTAHYAFTPAGDKNVSALRSKEKYLIRNVEGRKTFGEKQQEVLERAKKRKEQEKMVRKFGKPR